MKFPQDLKNPECITDLSLNGFKLKNLSFLEKFKNLKILYLSFNFIQDLSPLKMLVHLKEIDFRDNLIKDISPIEKLINLINIDFSNNQISDIAPIKKLINLKILYLSLNFIQDLSPLKMLVHLKEIDFRDNLIKDISPIEKLINLINIDFSNNQISDIAPINKLINLINIDFSNNQISDIAPINKLINLINIDFSNNQISDIAPINKLINLINIDFSNNQISDIAPINKLINLNTISFSNNKISDITTIRNLLNLKILRLNCNNISDITPIFNLDVKYCTILNNPIQRVPPTMLDLEYNDIKKYLIGISGKTETLNEAKVIFIGEGGAGKTSIRKRIIDPNAPLPTDKDTTRGIDIDHWSFTTDKDQEIKLNLWDFGGQLIYHSTHRFFLSHNALYLLITDNRECGTDFDYWCYFIRKFAGNSPIIIVNNEKYGRPSHSCPIDHLKDNLKNISGPIDIDISINKNRDSLIDKIENAVLTLPDINMKFPKKWAHIRNTLSSKKENYIFINEFFSLCQKKEIESDECFSILKCLHSLGDIIYFSEESNLKNIIFLKPHWIIETVYLLLDEKKIEENKGEFDQKIINSIWNDRYTNTIHDELIALLKKFLLVYKKDGTNLYIFPQLLPQIKPSYDIIKDYKEFVYQYSFYMPRGLLHKLMVLMHDLIFDHIVWRSGFIIKHQYSDTFAEITENYHKKSIVIRIEGQCIRELVAIIMLNMDKINTFFNTEDVKINLPCPCGCKTGIFNYDIVMKYHNNKIETIDCSSGPTIEKVKIKDLLGDVNKYLSEKQIEKERETHRKIKIFLASSSELLKYREQIEININRINKVSYDHRLFFHLDIWEDIDSKLNASRKQDDYNLEIDKADIFICLVHTKVGKYTREEFERAYNNLKKDKKPKDVYVFFITEKCSTLDIDISLFEFKKYISSLGQVIDPYANIEEVLNKITDIIHNKYFFTKRDDNPFKMLY